MIAPKWQTHLVGAAALVLLAGCSSLGGLSASGGGRGVAQAISADLSRALFAIDVPLAVEPLPPGPRLVISVPGETGLDAILVPADAEQLMQALRPPEEGRTYYAFALAESDRPAFVALQQRLGGRAASATVNIVPALCAAAGTDPARERISVLPVLDGQALPPVIAGATLASLTASSNGRLPVCKGHSG